MDDLEQQAQQINEAISAIRIGVTRLHDLGFNKEEVENEFQNVMDDEFADREYKPGKAKPKRDRK